MARLMYEINEKNCYVLLAPVRMHGPARLGRVSFGLRRSHDDDSVGREASELLRPAKDLDAVGSGGPQPAQPQRMVGLRMRAGGWSLVAGGGRGRAAPSLLGSVVDCCCARGERRMTEHKESAG